MKKITAKDLKRYEKSGTVRRAAAPVKEAPSPVKETPHASMAASMATSDASHAATQQLIARNTEVVSEFTEQVKGILSEQKQAVPGTQAPSPWDAGATFDLKRGKDKLLSRVYARPGILED